MQPLGGKKITHPHRTKEIMPPLGTKEIMPPLGTKKITQPLGTKKNYATSWDKKNPQPLGSRLSEIVLKGQKWSKNLQISVKEYQNVQYRLKWS